MLALPLLRWLAVLAGLIWILLAPPEYAGWHAVHGALLGFLLYSVALTAALWRWPGRLFRLSMLVERLRLDARREEMLRRYDQVLQQYREQQMRSEKSIQR